MRDPSEGSSPAPLNSPSQTKLVFGMKKTAVVTNSSNQSSKSKLDIVFSTEDNDVERKPKKKLVPIEYSDDEGPVDNGDRRVDAGGGRGGDKGGGGDGERGGGSFGRSPKSSGSRRSRRSSGRMSRGSRDERGGDKGSNGGGEVGIVMRGRGGLGDGIVGVEEGVKDRKLTPEERKKVVQQLVNNIPTAKEEVFKYDLKWDQIDKVKFVK